MPFTESTNRFDYRAALSQIGVTAADHLWTRLQTAARSRTDLGESQVIHDMSWVLTQLPEKERAQLEAIRNEIVDRLGRDMGPQALPMLDSFGITVESFVLPLAKARANSHGDLALLLGLGEAIHRAGNMPPPRFAGLFALHWSRQQIVSKLREIPITAAQRGRRAHTRLVGGDCTHCHNQRVQQAKFERSQEDVVREAGRRIAQNHAPVGTANLRAELLEKLAGFLGETVSCNHCEGNGLDNHLVRQAMQNPLNHRSLALMQKISQGQNLTVGEVKAAFGATVACRHCQGRGYDLTKCAFAAHIPLPANPRKAVADLVMAFDDNGAASVETLLELLGDAIACPKCGRWAEVPAGARSGWVCPLLDGEARRQGCSRISVA